MISLAPHEYRTILRSDFYSFIHRCFHELYPQATFLANWHIELMAAKLDACRQGKIRRLIINVPPRHLKSLCATIALPAFLLGHDPAAQIICASYGQDLSDKLARDCRAIMMSQFYQQIFPARLEQSAVQELTTSDGGFRMATSVGGVLTGRGGDIVIIDDPLKPDEALSQSQRNAVNQWYDNTLISRLNSKQDGIVIVVMQRLHQDDLVGHVLGQGNWEVLNLAAIAETRQEYLVENLIGSYRQLREPGDVLHPERESREALDELRHILGEYNFAGQYQQSPAPLGGGLVKEAWFKRYTDSELPPAFDQIIQSWDTASKPGELNDFSVCTTWGVKEKRIFLLNVFRKKLGYPDLKRAVGELAAIYEPSVILIEDKASGTQLIQELIEERVHQVQRYKPEHDKVMRLHAQTATIENGFVYLPREAHWLAEYLFELTTFPNSKHDDQTDSTSQALGWMKHRPSGYGILEYMRLQAEAATRGPSRTMFRIQAPFGTSHVITLSGRQIQVPNDRIIEVDHEERGPLIGAGFTCV
jgi:predicted phage terminase large subunit-like protein